MGVNPRPIMVNKMPPISSFFHAKIRSRSKTNEGIRCTIKAPI
jgi:hypothetical protein